MNLAGQIVELVLWVFIGLLIVRVVVSWVQMFSPHWHPRGVLLVVLEAVYTVTDPPIRAMRRIIPPLRVGSMMIDLAFLAVMVIAYVLLSVNRMVLLRA